MPYEQALAHFEIGRCLDPGDPSRQEHLTRAAELFRALGADYDLAHARLELTKVGSGPPQ
jgi:hypothetical protein